MSQAPGIALQNDDRPNAGTRCEGCESMGHWCQATRYVDLGMGEVAACAACGSGRECDVLLARQQSENAVLARFDSPTGAVRVVTPVNAEQCVAAAEPKPTAWREQLERTRPVVPAVRIFDGRNGRADMDQKILDRIKDAPADMTTSALARRLGIDEKSCWYHRNKFRKAAAVAEPNAKAASCAATDQPQTKVKPAAPAVPVVPVVPAVAVVPHARARISRPAPAAKQVAAVVKDVEVSQEELRKAAGSAEVSFRLSGETLDAWWYGLDVRVKADLLAARMAFLLERGEGQV